MKKTLLLPAIALVVLVGLVGLGLTLFLSGRGTSSLNPTAPIPYPRPEDGQSLHIPDQSGPNQEPVAPQATEPTESQTAPTSPEQNAADPPLVPDGTIVSEDGDLAIVYNANYDMDVYGDTQTGDPLDIYTDSKAETTINLNIITRTSGKLHQLNADVVGTDAEIINTYSQRTFQRDQHIVIVGPGTHSSSPGTSHISATSTPIALTLAGIDWTEALRLYERMEEADTAYRLSPSTPGNAQAKHDARTAYTNYLEQYEREAELLQVSAPEYSAVLVSIDLSRVPAGTTIDTILVHIDGENYTLPLGQIRFHGPRQEAPGHFGSSGQGYAHFYQNRRIELLHWDDGSYTASFDFTATENMILDRIEVLNDNGTVISGTWIRQVDREIWELGIQEGKSDVDIAWHLYKKSRFPGIQPSFWDGKTPFYVNAGERLCIDVELFDPMLAQTAHYQGALHYALHYTTAQGSAIMYIDGDLQQQPYDLDELYYTYLEGMDLRAYYTYANRCKDSMVS